MSPADKAKADILEYVQSEVRDPESTRFRNIVVYHPNGYTACGEINTKNGFGGYTGWMQFAAAQNFAIVNDGTHSARVFATMQEAMCK